LEDGTKVRYARGMNASGAVIPRPEILKERRKPRPTSRMSHKNLILRSSYGDPHLILYAYYMLFFMAH
jgi:large subunit ribosomal protein L24